MKEGQAAAQKVNGRWDLWLYGEMTEVDGRSHKGTE